MYCLFSAMSNIGLSVNGFTESVGYNGKSVRRLRPVRLCVRERVVHLRWRLI